MQRKQLIIYSIVFVFLIVAIFSIRRYSVSKEHLSSKEILDARKQYTLYTDVDAGFRDSLIFGTEKLSEDAFSYMVEEMREKQNFALVKATICKAPKQSGENQYQVEAECISLAGGEKVEENAVLYLSKEYFYNWEEILKEERKFLFLVVDGKIARNKSWYLVKKKRREYILPVLHTEAMECYDGVLVEKLIMLFSK